MIDFIYLFFYFMCVSCKEFCYVIVLYYTCIHRNEELIYLYVDTLNDNEVQNLAKYVGTCGTQYNIRIKFVKTMQRSSPILGYFGLLRQSGYGTWIPRYFFGENLGYFSKDTMSQGFWES